MTESYSLKPQDSNDLGELLELGVLSKEEFNKRVAIREKEQRVSDEEREKELYTQLKQKYEK